MRNIFDGVHNTTYILDLCTMSELNRAIASYNYVCNYLKNINAENINLNELRNIFNECSELMLLHYLDDIDELGYNPYEHLHNLIIDLLSKKINNEFLGDLMIKKSIEDGVFFTIPELDYDTFKEYFKLGLDKMVKFDHLYNDSDSVAIVNPDYLDMKLCVYSNAELTDLGYNENTIRKIDAFYLKVIRHEIGHIKQHLFQREVKSKKYNDLMSLVDVFKHQNLYFKLYDYLPEEYYADMRAFECTINDLKDVYYTTHTEELLEYTMRRMVYRYNKYPENPFNEIIIKIKEMIQKGEINNLIGTEIIKMTEDFINRYKNTTSWKEDGSIIKRLIK